MNGTDITEAIIIGIIVIAFGAGTFLCWIAGSYFRKIYYICVTLWEALGIFDIIYRIIGWTILVYLELC